MGMKHRVEFGLYVVNGSINCQLAEKTGFTDEDAEKIKQALLTLFENDTSSARPDGSMEVCRLYWWKHNGKTPKYSSAKVHRQVVVTPNKERPKSFGDYDVVLNELDGLNCEKFEDLI
jgi:CRISPR-associated protein Csd2